MLLLACFEERSHVRAVGAIEHRSLLANRWEDVVGVGSPSTDRTPLSCFHAEDESQEGIQAADGKEEEGSDEGEVVNEMGKDGCTNQTLKNSKWTETKSCAENGEEPVEGGHGPATFGEDEDDDLSDDEELVNNSPKDPSCLVWNCTIPGFAKVRNHAQKKRTGMVRTRYNHIPRVADQQGFQRFWHHRESR